VILRPDVRAFKNREDSYDRCRKCGTALVILPDDRRQGYCHDCFEPLDISMHEFCARIPQPEASFGFPERH